MWCKIGWWTRWPRCPKRGLAAAPLLGLRVRIPPLSRKSISCERCVFSGRDLCVGLITRPEESYRVWCVWVRSWNLISEAAKDRHAQVLIEKWLCSNSLFTCRHDCQTNNHEYSLLCTWENFYEPWTLNDEGHAFCRNVRKLPATQRPIPENENRWAICNRWSARHEISDRNTYERAIAKLCRKCTLCLRVRCTWERPTRCTLFSIIYVT